jgi:hypothetical protein
LEKVEENDDRREEERIKESIREEAEEGVEEEEEEIRRVLEEEPKERLRRKRWKRRERSFPNRLILYRNWKRHSSGIGANQRTMQAGQRGRCFTSGISKNNAICEQAATTWVIHRGCSVYFFVCDL